MEFNIGDKVKHRDGRWGFVISKLQYEGFDEPWYDIEVVNANTDIRVYGTDEWFLIQTREERLSK